jgi:hypothetical protein
MTTVKSVVGVALVGFGVIALAYFVSPLRLMVLETFEPNRIDPLPGVIGGLALVCGVALLFRSPH